MSLPACGLQVVTVAGVGSLVSEASARESFDFSNFRVGEVREWRRSFCQSNWVNVASGGVSLESNEVAALAMVPAADYVSHVALLDVVPSELPGFYEREAGYRIVSVPFSVKGQDGSVIEEGQALMCAACDDDAEAERLWAPDGEMARRCEDQSYVREWMSRALRPMWPAPQADMPLRPCDCAGTAQSVEARLAPPISLEELPRGLVPGLPLYPAPGYLRDCAQAHEAAGLLQHFLDSTCLSDRRTTLTDYLAANPGLDEYIRARVPSS
ncbi:unnamed protein product [Symbiodinium sp. CCMP2456]|nr:unnamed protein product [Symbiodinium sp. CCMP2456]